MSRLTRVLTAGIAVAAIAAVVLTGPAEARLPAAVCLVLLLPAYLAAPLWGREVDSATRAVLGLGVAYVALAVVTFAAAFLPGPLTALQLVAGSLVVDALLLLAAAWSRRRAPGAAPETSMQTSMQTMTPLTTPSTTPKQRPRRQIAGLALVLVVACLLRLPSLGYAEYQDDEFDVAMLSRLVLTDAPEAIFADRRGPAQPLITAAFFVLTDSSREIVPRVPVAIANLAFLATVTLLAGRMFGSRPALFGGLLLALDGFVLAYSRVVQMQSTMLWMQALVVLCLYRYVLERRPGPRRRFELSAAVFFAFGLLAHYEIVVALPVVGLLYLAAYRRHGWRGLWRGTLGAIAAGGTLAGSFYLLFVLQPQFADTYAYYSGNVDWRLHPNAYKFRLIAAFYSGVPYVATMAVLLAVAWSRSLRTVLATYVPRLPRGRAVRAGWGIAWGVGGLLLVAALRPNGPLWPALLGLIVLAAIVTTAPSLRLAWRVGHLWLLACLIPYLFLMRELHVHYYIFAAPWCLLAGATADALVGRRLRLSGGSIGRRALATAGLAAAAGLLVLVGLHHWLVFVQSTPKYALAKPPPRHWAVSDMGLHGEAFGFPHKSGWKTVGMLYRQGILRGPFETNELYLKAYWYTREYRRADERPRYYFVAHTPHRLQAHPWPPPLDPAAYRLLGHVTEQDRPILDIFETVVTIETAETIDVAGATGTIETPSGSPPATFAVEDYDRLYDADASPRDWALEATYKADDNFFRTAAETIAGRERGGDGLLLHDGHQAAILGYYYTGRLPYAVPPSSTDRPSWLAALVEAHPRLWALYWAEQTRDPDRMVERWLAEHAFEAGEEWLGNLRLVQYDAAQLPAALPATSSGHRFGPAIGLERYRGGVRSEGSRDVLYLSLDWQPQAMVGQRYKVFVHVLDAEGRTLAQSDSEPAGGTRPTDAWEPGGESIVDNHRLVVEPAASGEPATAEHAYRVAIGLYDPASGARLPVTDAQGARLPDDRALIDVAGGIGAKPPVTR